MEAIKVLLEAQNNSFKRALDVIVEQLNSRIKATEETVRDLTRSLEFSQAEVKDLQSQVSELMKRDNSNKDIIETLKRKICELEQRSNYQKDYNRRCNLRISGVPEQQGVETWEVTANTVKKLLQDKLQLPSMQIERAHRTGQASHVTGRPRTIVARFERYGDREAVFRNAKKLRGTNIFINDDLCPASLELRKIQMPQLKQAKEDVSRVGGDIESTVRQSLPASAGGRLSAAAAARDGNGGGAAAVVDSVYGAGVDGGAAAPVSVTGVAMSPAGGVLSPGRRYAAAASAVYRGASGVGEGATLSPAKNLRNKKK
ncbi:hypothetical protein Pmani_018985 [Petrolisthes manimaculis]|uniref:Uncharacterized protein n=2 Tax=Petrolisthes manimaculis TaxID=1843537 RepID=A0AAE1U7W3_9EUCA|nr:hypothetical protein Pmani_018985 [Petrolisthes manimaculis]